MDPIRELNNRLSNGEIIIIDGAMGSELQARGVPMSSDLWCGQANLDAPDVVRSIHEDYIRAGADVIITNTFPAGRFAHEAAGQAGTFETVNRRAAELAREARENVAEHPVVIAGSMSQWGIAETYDDGGSAGSAPAGPSDQDIYDAYRVQASILADSGVDVILLECLEPNWMPALAAARDVGLPIWVGPSAIVTNSGRPLEALGGTPLDEAFGAMHGPGVEAVTVMHSDIDAVVPAIKEIRRQWPGYVGAYPHVGRFVPPNWVFTDVSPSAFAEQAAEWVDAGAQIVGGCCGTRPEHIRALKERLPAHVRQTAPT